MLPLYYEFFEETFLFTQARSNIFKYLLEVPFNGIKLRNILPYIVVNLKFTIAVILNKCEESNLKSRDKLLALQPFKLDSSHPLRMTAMVNIFIASGFLV